MSEHNCRRPLWLAAMPLALLLAGAPALSQEGPGNPPLENPAPTPEPPKDEEFPPEVELPDEGADAPLQFTSRQFEFGEIYDHERVTHLFEFVNASDKPVTVLRVTADCGCTLSRLVGDKMVFAPGEKGQVEAVFDPEGRRGPQRKRVTVEIQNETTPRIMLNMSGAVRPLIVVDPKRMHFGQVSDGTAMEDFISIAGRGPEFRVLSVEVPDEYFSVEIGETGAMQIVGEPEPLRQTRLKVRLSGEAPRGNLNTVAVVRTNDPKMPKVSVPLSAFVVGHIRVSPERIALRPDEPGTPFVREFRLISRNNRDFTIKDAVIEGPAEMNLVLDFEPMNQSSRTGYVFRLVGVMPPDEVFARGSVKIKTDMPGDEELEVKFHSSSVRASR